MDFITTVFDPPVFNGLIYGFAFIIFVTVVCIIVHTITNISKDENYVKDVKIVDKNSQTYLPPADAKFWNGTPREIKTEDLSRNPIRYGL